MSNYITLKPNKKMRNLFSDDEYINAVNIEEAYWMNRQETALVILPEIHYFFYKIINRFVKLFNK